MDGRTERVKELQRITASLRECIQKLQVIRDRKRTDAPD